MTSVGGSIGSRPRWWSATADPAAIQKARSASPLAARAVAPSGISIMKKWVS